MNGSRLIGSEWGRYKVSFFFYLFFLAVITAPFVTRTINAEIIDEAILLVIITLTTVVLAATEMPRLIESGIIRSILLSNISRESFYVFQFVKYIGIFFVSFFFGMVSFFIAFPKLIDVNWIVERFIIYLVILIFYSSFSQCLSVFFKKTVETLMTCIVSLFILVPIFNSFFNENNLYKKLPFLYLEPKNLLMLSLSELLYPFILLICCSVIIQFIGLNKMKKMEV
ncbi:hypothetical protein FJQ98_24425 [Lysinibacillus agricola]|uniref:ABC transporter permease n=1 Tax=Lysinibacillus agricola TaxID=2590012 RepID=A0ABX7AQU6_9BACI|nr:MULTISPECIES: hypothetical protein [Lysinibacillus]KOS63227.1 hypothetical protein AN161_08385 [Lysinibacillus sp. FJAT-14222]QQP12204.1 hypothetical protein FJQ98_24425 [Lysinibacillus agricola]